MDRSKTNLELITEKHTAALRQGFKNWPTLEYGKIPAMGDMRWTSDLIFSIWSAAETGETPQNGLNYQTGASNGGFDLLDFNYLPQEKWLDLNFQPALAIDLNKRSFDKRIKLPFPFYGGGMSYGSISENIMLARAKAAEKWGIFTCTGEGGYPESLIPYKDNIITQIATGMFGVQEKTIRYAPIIEFKYAQGAKPGLGGHLLGDKATTAVAKMRGSVPWVSLFSPFPFHSVYSVEDHKKTY